MEFRRVEPRRRCNRGLVGPAASADGPSASMSCSSSPFRSPRPARDAVSECMTADIALAETPHEIAATWAVMRQLRPHLDAEAYLDRVTRLRAEREFELARMIVDGEVVAVAGLRFGEWLHGGRYLEIEDFVTGEECRSQGYGGEFFDWIVALAREAGCGHLRLLSGVQREAAHRFYRRKGMSLDAYYFSIDL